MKFALAMAALTVVAVSCSKTDHNNSTDQNVTTSMQVDTCTFGFDQFNLSKRESLSEEATRKPGKGNSGGGGTTTTPTTPAGGSVIYIDVDGHTVSGTLWNGGATFTCAPANMTTAELQQVIDRVSNDYSPFNVTVTFDENVYNNANIYRRTRVVVTESWEWYGQAGGTALLNSFTSGSNNPCFVFSSLLYYSGKNVAEAVSHEAGHTLGLRHQSSYSNCTLTAAYNSGTGSGETSWAPIMGNSYSRNLSLWHNGNTTSCSIFQDDVNVINNVLGSRVDDHVNGFSGAATLVSSLNGILNNINDVDVFLFSTSTPKTINAAPFSSGAGNNGANMDIILKLYNTSGQLIATANDPNVVNAALSVSAGNYYVSVQSSANANTGNYGMLGRYSVTAY